MANKDDKFKDLVELSKQYSNSKPSKHSSSSPISSPSGTESDSVQYNFLGPNIIVDAVDEAKHPVSSPAIGKPKRSAPKSRAKKADDAVREDNKKRQKYFRDQMKELFEKLAAVLRPPLGKDEKTKKVLQHAIDYIESLHSLLEYYQNITQQIASINPELFQYVSSQSPPPTPNRNSQSTISVVSSTPPSPHSTRTDQSTLSQGTANSSRTRGPSSPGSTDFSSEVSWISQVLQFSSPSRSPNSPFMMSQYDIKDLDSLLAHNAQFSPSSSNQYGAVQQRSLQQHSMQQQQSLQQQPMSQMQPQPTFNQYSSFLSDPFSDMPPSPITKPVTSSPSHAWNTNLDLFGAMPASPTTVSTSTNSHASSGFTTMSAIPASPIAPASGGMAPRGPPKPAVAIKIEPSTIQHHAPPSPASSAPRPSPHSAPISPSISASAPKASSLLACDEETFDWSSVSNTPNQTPDRKPIPSLEALSDSLQSLTVSKANGTTVVIKTEK